MTEDERRQLADPPEYTTGVIDDSTIRFMGNYLADDPVVRVMMGGRVVFYYMTPDVYRALLAGRDISLTRRASRHVGGA